MERVISALFFSNLWSFIRRTVGGKQNWLLCFVADTLSDDMCINAFTTRSRRIFRTRTRSTSFSVECKQRLGLSKRMQCVIINAVLIARLFTFQPALRRSCSASHFDNLCTEAFAWCCILIAFAPNPWLCTFIFRAISCFFTSLFAVGKHKLFFLLLAMNELFSVAFPVVNRIHCVRCMYACLGALAERK